MRGGDLSDRVAPRWIIQFEGVIADVPDDLLAPWKLAVRARRWKRAAGYYQMHPRTSQILWDLYWRQDYRFDAVTFLGGEKFAEAVARWLDVADIPVSHVFYDTPEHLARSLVTMPAVQHVVHADPSHALTYGPRGLLVNDPQTMRML